MRSLPKCREGLAADCQFPIPLELHETQMCIFSTRSLTLPSKRIAGPVRKSGDENQLYVWVRLDGWFSSEERLHLETASSDKHQLSSVFFICVRPCMSSCACTLESAHSDRVIMFTNGKMMSERLFRPLSWNQINSVALGLFTPSSLFRVVSPSSLTNKYLFLLAGCWTEQLFGSNRLFGWSRLGIIGAY